MNFNLSTSMALARAVLKIPSDGNNIESVLSSFNKGEPSHDRILSKNILLRYLWIGCKNRNKELYINQEVFDCKKCGGRGEEYIFIQREIKVPCIKCGGVGMSNPSCKNCEDKKGTCEMCLYSSPCSTCSASGVAVLDRTIITNTKHCSVCNGTGKKIVNPVLTEEMATKIKKSFKK